MKAFRNFFIRSSKYGIGYVLKVIITNKVYRNIDELYLIIGRLIFRKIPLKDYILLESHNDFDMNCGTFYNYLIENEYNKKYKIIWRLRNKVPRNLPENVIGFNMYKPSLRKTFYYCTAKYNLCDHVKLGNQRKNQISIYLTHGSIGLKKVEGIVNFPDDMNYILGSSEFMLPYQAKDVGLEYPNNKQLLLGYPIHDIFYNDKIEGDLKKLSNRNFSKVILWMPTFRKPMQFNRNDSNKELPLGVPILSNIEQYKKINNILKEQNALLIIKIHPMQDLTTVKIDSVSNIHVLNAKRVKKFNIDNYRLMKDVDALISDYSSSIYDFLHADKPVAFTLDDANDYKLGFIFENPLDFMPGHIIYTYEEFVAFLHDVLDGKDLYDKKRHDILKLFYKYQDGNNCKRLVDFLGL